MTRTITVLFILLTEIVNTMGFCVVSFRLQKGLSLYNAGNDYSTWEGAFPDAEVVHVSLPKHRPLGCTVEESLADSDLQPVFVSKVGFLKLFVFSASAIASDVPLASDRRRGIRK